MAVEDLRLSEDIEAEFNPLVVIIASQPDRYSKFAEHLLKNGFKAEVYSDSVASLTEQPKPGTIFFVSFNLTSEDPAALAKTIESHHNVCIVFAELEGFDTAAKLSSAKMTQTLQHPYTEKNFLMAVQTIVKKRKVQHEKNLRKNTVLERRKGASETSADGAAERGNRVFKAEQAATPSTAPVIIQKGLNAQGPKTARIHVDSFARDYSAFMAGRKSKSLSELQQGMKSATFMLVPNSPVRGKITVDHGDSQHVKGARGGTAVAAGAALSKAQPSPLAHREPKREPVAQKAEVETPIRLAKSQQSEPSTPALPRENTDPVSMKTGEPSALSEVTQIGNFVIPKWVLIAVFSIGILFCLFFIYQMLFHRI